MAGGIALAVLSAGLQFLGQRKTEKAAKARAAAEAAERRRAEALQQRRDSVIATRQRRRSAAEARRLRAQSVNLAANRGVGGAIGAQGSIVPGVSANITQQLNANNAFVNTVTSLNAGIRTAFGNAQTIGNQPITAGSTLTAFGSLAGKLAGSSKVTDFLNKNIFS